MGRAIHLGMRSHLDSLVFTGTMQRLGGDGGGVALLRVVEGVIGGEIRVANEF